MKPLNMVRTLLLSSLVIPILGCEATPTSREQAAAPEVAPAPTATSNVREIIRITNDRSAALFPRVSPSGDTVLVTLRDTTKRGTEALSIASYNIDNLGRQFIAGPFASGASWINDNEIVYTYFRGSTPSIVKQSFSQHGMQFLNPSSYGQYDSEASFNARANRFVFRTNIGNTPHICVVDNNGRGFTLYVEGRYPQWHPQGDRILFHRQVGDHNQVFLLDVDRGSVSQLTFGDHHSLEATWSPDGSRIVFVSSRDGHRHIYTMNPDGSDMVQFTSGNTHQAFPDWPDGNRIFFSSNAGAPGRTSLNPYQWEHADIWMIRIR